MKILGIIPARGGSKGIPRKNIQLVAGKPLIVYTIEAGLQSKILTYLVISTDDDEIAKIAEKFGSHVIHRPPELAADDTPMLPVIKHVFKTLEEKNETYDIGIILQPTAPLRTSEDIDWALKKLIESESESVVSFYEAQQDHPYNMYRLENNCLKPILEKPSHIHRRQDFPKVYIRNGAIYAFKKSVIYRYGNIYGINVHPYIMPAERSINIDTEFDLLLTDFLLRKKISDK